MTGITHTVCCRSLGISSAAGGSRRSRYVRLHLLLTHHAGTKNNVAPLTKSITPSCCPSWPVGASRWRRILASFGRHMSPVGADDETGGRGERREEGLAGCAAPRLRYQQQHSSSSTAAAAQQLLMDADGL
ncbi:hypothetical protein D4764_09G0004980 [Takifugu flavidus]|uniref:Uncharacterized protein n=1 Tax=Takifugu flavidus TaxID=433684 RepID=A0A5C6MKX0_9TELE|nr:hypothetical protein D4764_09G0004980 [Takifugu flavidus]